MRPQICMLTHVPVELVEELGQEASRANEDERGRLAKRKRGELLWVCRAGVCNALDAIAEFRKSSCLYGSALPDAC